MIFLLSSNFKHTLNFLIFIFIYKKWIVFFKKWLNYINIIYKKDKPIRLKRVSELLFGNKNGIRNKKNYNNKKLREDKNYIEINEHKEYLKYLKNNNSKKQKKIIDDNYNEYLKGISSSSSKSNKSKNEIRNINNKNHILIIQNLKSIKDDLSLNDKFNISKYKKRLYKNNDSSIIIKNNLNDMSKGIILENNILRKKIMLEKSALI